MLKRYLRARYGLSPDAYRAKWNLPADYPMTAPNYAARRSDFAKQIGLGKPVRRKGLRLFFEQIFQLSDRGIGQGVARRAAGPTMRGFDAGGGIDRRRLDDIPMDDKFNEDFDWSGCSLVARPA